MNGLPGAAHLRQLGQQEVEGAAEDGDHQQRAGPDPLHAGQLVERFTAGLGRRRSRPTEEVVLTPDGPAGRRREGERLEQPDGGGDALPAR